MDKHGIEKNEEQFHHFISLLIDLSNDHHRQAGFFSKIKRILTKYRRRIQEISTNVEILKEGILKVNAEITELIKSKQKFNCNSYSNFFKNEMTKSDNDKDQNELIEYEQKRQIGENDSYICPLIHQDSVEEFISYVNRSNISLSSRINQSIFETDSFWIGILRLDSNL